MPTGLRCFVPLILPAILLAVALPSASIALHVRQLCGEWKAARPVVMDVDLSRPGQFTADLEQTGDRCCQQIFYVQLAAGDGKSIQSSAPDMTAKEMFDGLVAKLIVERTDGSTCAEFDLQHYDGVDHETGAMQIVGMHHPAFANGKYKARVEVTSPAVGLAGQKQTIYGRYILCGLEYGPAYIFGLISAATGLPGVILLLRAALVRPRQQSKPKGDPEIVPHSYSQP